jgi:hypothetical protein
MTAATISFDIFTDDQLLHEVQRLVACERSATAALLRSLMEVDARHLYLREGCSSLFTYCTQVLHLAEGAAYNRIETARAARRLPAVLDAIADGSITLTAARLLAPHLTLANHQDLLGAARHKSKRDVELLVATIHPQPAAPTVLRRVPTGRQCGGWVAVQGESVGQGAAPNDDSAAQPEPAPVADVRPPAPPAPAPMVDSRPAVVAESPRATATALSATSYKLQVTISSETHDKLRRAQDLLRHAVPDGDLAVVLDRALTLLLADLERRRCAAVAAPRNEGQIAGTTRHIPAAIKRAVWKRDDGRCAFRTGNRRCTETSFLEFHHVEPYATGGPATVGNIELRWVLCRYRHKRHYADWRIMPRRRRQHAKTQGPHRQPAVLSRHNPIHASLSFGR